MFYQCDQLKLLITEKFPQKISQTVSDQSIRGVPADKLIRKLSFSHFVELFQIDDFIKRTFYEPRPAELQIRQSSVL